MDSLTPRQRFVASMTFKPVDRCFLKPDGFSPSTIKRWEQEGLPKNCNPNEYFAMDPREFIRVNMECYPGFNERVLQEDENYVTLINSEGITLKQRKTDALDAMPQFVDWPVKSRKDFECIAEQFQYAISSRYPTDYEKKVDYWNNVCTAPVAFELRGMVFHRLRMWMGLEDLCMAMYDDPAWVHEMVNFLEDFLINVSQKVLSEVKCDYVYACDDIGYKTSSLISPALFYKFFFESTKRIIAYVRDAGIPVIVMDSDGNMDEFAQIYFDAGFNALCPIEVAAGNDLIKMRKRFGKKLALQGGFDKRVLAMSKDAIRKEVLRLYPYMMVQGGFAPNIDHVVPEEVSFENYSFYVELLKQVVKEPESYL